MIGALEFVRKRNKSKDYEGRLRMRLAEKYGIEAPERINLDKAAQYELEYLQSSAAKIEQALDELAYERHELAEYRSRRRS